MTTRELPNVNHNYWELGLNCGPSKIFSDRLENPNVKTRATRGKMIKDEFFNNYQPERSKREDYENLNHDFTGIPTTEESWCRKCGMEDHVIKLSKMRCSEHYGNIVRDK